MRVLIILLLLSQMVYGQEEELVRIMEDQAEQDDVKEVEEDLQLLRLPGSRPLNINTATAEQLQAFTFLTALHIEQLMLYRKYAGDLIDTKELQAVPGWDVQVVRKLMPYIIVRDAQGISETFRESMDKGRHQWLTRFALSKNAGLLLRYHFNSPQLQWGLNIEKDAGERLVQGSKGLSFISGHAMIRDQGVLKLFVVGDYIMNLGQGLTLWQGRAVRKTAIPMLVKRQLPVIMPYRSNDENRYFRGTALWFAKGKFESALFISYNGLDANTAYDSSKGYRYATSFLNTGYHRDHDELEDKNSVKLFSGGVTISVGQKRLRVGASSVYHRFSLPINREPLPYNLFAAKGRTLSNHAVNVHHTWRNVHFFGELAIDREGDLAAVSGFMLAADSKLDIAVMARKIGRSYRSFFANAFTESTEPANEEGFYTGISLRLSSRLTLEAYADHYRFPWLRYRVDAPGWGRDYMVQWTLKPDKRTQVYLRSRYELKTGGDVPAVVKNISPASRHSLRIHIQHKINNEWECRFRFEGNLLSEPSRPRENGFIFYSDWFWSPLYKPFSFNLRAMVCETSSYTSRIYTYENDVMFYNIVPGFYGSLGRLYINTSLNMTKNARLFLKIAKTFQTTGSNWQTRIQFIYSM